MSKNRNYLTVDRNNLEERNFRCIFTSSNPIVRKTKSRDPEKPPILRKIPFLIQVLNQPNSLEKTLFDPDPKNRENSSTNHLIRSFKTKLYVRKSLSHLIKMVFLCPLIKMNEKMKGFC